MAEPYPAVDPPRKHLRGLMAEPCHLTLIDPVAEPPKHYSKIDGGAIPRPISGSLVERILG
jgi:hypothetical protein